MTTDDPFGPEQTNRYWEIHATKHGGIDRVEDPDGLANVCHPGAPTWLNRYYARLQRSVFDELLRDVGIAPEGRALDVGCGAGRWTRALLGRGYAVTGIDLQEELIAENRSAIAGADFRHASIQDFETSERFDLIVSVTVLQHIPHSEQGRAVGKIRELSATGGHVLMLENVLDQAPHVFSRSIDDWEALLRSHGYSLVRAVPYDYGLAMRAVNRLRRRVNALRQPSSTPESLLSPSTGSGARSILARTVQRSAIEVDARLEPVFARSARSPARSVHCGFLFRLV